MWRICQEIPLSWINLLLSWTLANEIRSQLISSLQYVLKFVVSLSLYQVIFIATSVQFVVGRWDTILPGNILRQVKYCNYSTGWNSSWKYSLKNGAILHVLYNKHSPKQKHLIISAVVQIFRLVLELLLSYNDRSFCHLCFTTSVQIGINVSGKYYYNATWYRIISQWLWEDHCTSQYSD